MKFWEAVRDNEHIFGKMLDLVYDDASCLYSKEKLNLEHGVLKLELSKETPGGDVCVSFSLCLAQ